MTRRALFVLAIPVVLVAAIAVRSITIRLTIPGETVAATGNAAGVIGIVIAAILALLLAVWLMSHIRIPARACGHAAVVPARARARREVKGGESVHRSSILGALVRAGLKAILALTVFIGLGFVEEALLWQSRRSYPQPDAWWWNHDPHPSAIEPLVVAVAFFAVSIVIAFVLNFRAGGEDRGVRRVVVGTTALYMIFTVVLKIVT